MNAVRIMELESHVQTLEAELRDMRMQNAANAKAISDLSAAVVQLTRPATLPQYPPYKVTC